MRATLGFLAFSLVLSSFAATINVCPGMRFSVSAESVGLETFSAPPTLFILFNGRELKAKTLDKRSVFPKTTVSCAWPADIPAGKYALYAATGDGRTRSVGDEFRVNAPAVFRFGPSRVASGGTLTLYGKYFGLPTRTSFALTTAGGEKVACRIVKPFVYPDWKGKPGAGLMDPDTGESQVSLLVRGDIGLDDQISVTLANRAGESRRTVNNPSKPWTYLLYMVGDNNLDVNMIQILEGLSAVDASTAAHVVVELDRAKGEDNHGEYGGWTITHRFYATRGFQPTEAQAIADWNDGKGGGRELDMSDPDNLTAFIDWAANLYPAERYALVIGDHGHGWRGLCEDNTPYGNTLGLKNVRQALEKASRKIDLLLFDDCHMQCLEAGYELRSSGPAYIVGSEAPLSPPFPHGAVLAELAKNPAMTPLDLGKAMVDRYAIANAEGTYYTLSVVSAAAAAAYAEQVNAFAKSMYDDSPFDQVKINAQTVMDATANYAVYSKAGGETAYCRGVSIYYPLLIPHSPAPLIPGDYDYFYLEKNVEFLKLDRWKGFLECVMRRSDHYLDQRIVNARQDLDLYGSSHIDLYEFCSRLTKSK